MGTRSATISRSRVGCLTCKRRRVKCDECKPCCKRCLSTDRTCEGYGIRIDKRPSTQSKQAHENSSQNDGLKTILPKPTTPIMDLPVLSPSQSSMFHRFRVQIIPAISGYRSSGFWKDIVVPACYSEPAILNASIALAYASCRQQGSGRKNYPLADRISMIVEYNAAIRSLQRVVLRCVDTASLRVSLIVCVLFISLEIRVGRIKEAMAHLNEGRILLHSLLDSCPLAGASNNESHISFPPLDLVLKSETVEDNLVSVFADLDIQSTYFGSSRPQLMLRATKPASAHSPHNNLEVLLYIPATFVCFEQTSQYLIILTNECLAFLGNTHHHGHHSVLNEESNQHREALCSKLKQWRLAYDRYIQSAVEPVKLQLNLVLWSHHMLVQHAWLSFMVPSARWEMKETDLDVFIPHFQTIISLCSSILTDASLVGKSFTLEFGLVLPLFCTAMKCRHGKTRREAVRLLRLSGLEGFWDPFMWAAIAEETIALEEVDKADTDRTIVNFEHNPNVLVPLHRRISNVEVVFKDGDDCHILAKFERRKWSNNGVSFSVDTIRKEIRYN